MLTVRKGCHSYGITLEGKKRNIIIEYPNIYIFERYEFLDSLALMYCEHFLVELAIFQDHNRKNRNMCTELGRLNTLDPGDNRLLTGGPSQ